MKTSDRSPRAFCKTTKSLSWKQQEERMLPCRTTCLRSPAASVLMLSDSAYRRSSSQAALPFFSIMIPRQVSMKVSGNQRRARTYSWQHSCISCRNVDAQSRWTSLFLRCYPQGHLVALGKPSPIHSAQSSFASTCRYLCFNIVCDSNSNFHVAERKILSSHLGLVVKLKLRFT